MNLNGITKSAIVYGIVAMALVVLASNILVQFPVQIVVGKIHLADILTWGAFIYPIAFLVTDFTNRSMGPVAARWVVFVGFVCAVVLSIYFSTPRIAIASGTAFLISQLLDVSVFNLLRRQIWWRAPLVSSLLGSITDTLIFFSLAFSASVTILGSVDTFAIENSEFLGVTAWTPPRWVSWAMGDFIVKLVVAMVLLAPYKFFSQFAHPVTGVRTV